MIEKRLLGLLLVLAAAIGAGLFVMGGSNFIVALGRNIPQDDLVWDYSIGLGWAAALGLSIFFWPVPARDRRLLLLGWLARSIVTLGFMLIYEYYYDTDSFGYFYASRVNRFIPEDIAIGHGTRAFASLMGLHQTIFPNSFHMMKVSCSMIGFIAVYLFYRAGVIFLKRDEPRLFYALALFPSILFWSSIVGKDPIQLLGVAVYAYAVIAWQRTFRFRYVAMMALGIIETMYLRAWFGAILLAPLAVFALYRTRGLLTKLAFAGIVVGALYVTAGNGGDKFDIGSSQDLVSTAQRYSHSQSVGGSAQYIDTEFTSVGRIAAFTPLGMFTALFRPLPGEVLNPFALLASFENLLLLVIFIQAMRKMRLVELGDPVVAWAGALIIIWSSAYGILSYQNLGAAVRYKLQILPVMVALLMYLNRPRPTAAPKELARELSGPVA